MTLDQYSGSPKVNRLPDQDVNARAAWAVGVPVHGRIGQTQDALNDPRLGGRRGRLPTSLPNAANGDPQRSGRVQRP
jgi:hypothetical protein